MTLIRNFTGRLVGIALVGLWCLCPGRDAAADDPPPKPRIEHTAIRSSYGGVFPYAAERWSVIAINVSNPALVPRDVISATYFDSEPTLQYARRIWLPPRSRLHTWVPVLVPNLPEGASQYSFHSLVFDAAQSREVLMKEDTGLNLHSGILPAQSELFVTGLIADPSPPPGSPSGNAYDLVVACRRSQQLSRRTSHLAEQLFAPDDFSLQPFDQLVVSSSRALGDPAGLAAIRRWLYKGGRLWVMLDQADAQILETILGDQFVCRVVDRVGLTSVRVDPAAQNGDTGSPVAEFEEPVDLVRVVVDDRDVDIEYTVNGWPAAFTKTYGRGRVLVTTLGPRAWIRPTRPEDSAAQREFWARTRNTPVDNLQDSAFAVLPPMQKLSGVMLHAMPRTRDFEQALASRASEYIGYSIPSRTVVGGLLAGFGGLVIAVGIWLWRKQALEHLGWAGPALGVGAAVVLCVVGGINRHRKESAVAAVQVIEALPGVDDANLSGGMVFYSPETVPWKIATDQGGRLDPEQSGLGGTTRRAVWSDLGTWSWENLRLETPQRTALYQQSLTPPQRLEARATFGPGGLSGRVTAGDAARLSEVMLATRDGRIGVDVRPDGTFVASADRVFDTDQYVEAGFLADEQDRRRRAFPLVLDRLLDVDWNGVPFLMAWTDEPRVGFEFDEGRKRLGASLLAIPLAFDRPAPGTDVRIPSPLLPFRAVNQPDGNPSSPVWSARRREWQNRTTASALWLRFQLPRELLPAELTGGRLTIQVTGPVMRMELFGLRQPDLATAVPIELWNNPVGSHTFELADRSLMQLDEAGGVVLGLTAGENPKLSDDPQADVSKPSPWRIVDLRIELTAKISGAADERAASNADR
ncbi:MAG: hypothetical protein HY290_12500 [Planctomycetia bacterium]|nr:hypothetical protein [Planctomycetia bacterium]